MNTNHSDKPARRDYHRIGAALAYLDRHRHRTVPLTELAHAIDLSPFHFQRLFTRWAGISPGRFARYLRLDDARLLLRDARSVLDATYDVGLSSPGRLHDLFVSIDAVTPGEFKSGGTGLAIRVGEHDSPFGRCLIGVTQRGLCWLSFADSVRDGMTELRSTWPAALIHRDPAATRSTARRIFSMTRVVSGKPTNLLVGGTNFQLKVWEALIRIPPGQVRTYAEVGASVARASAARAVGQAIAANPIAYLIPCHRVIRSMGIVGDYRWGATRKKAMIAWEAARDDNMRTGMPPPGKPSP